MQRKKKRKEKKKRVKVETNGLRACVKSLFFAGDRNYRPDRRHNGVKAPTLDPIEE